MWLILKLAQRASCLKLTCFEEVLKPALYEGRPLELLVEYLSAGIVPISELRESHTGTKFRSTLLLNETNMLSGVW